ncbi:hypothetical protein D0C16_12950 [Cellvibrio sp. KY-GH-1]|nr:hypothetical protein D0C16_12950 [Cellvibrio sp. KY-GH-1]
MNCWNCGTKQPFYKRFTLGMGENGYLRCKVCKQELVNENRIWQHFLTTSVSGAILAILIHDANFPTMIFFVVLLTVYLYGFIPIKKT